MKKYILGLLIVTMLHACIKTDSQMIIQSPDGKIEVKLDLKNNQLPKYAVTYERDTVIKPSSMGFEFLNQPEMAGFRVVDTRMKSVNKKWTMPWGEQKEVVNHYQEMLVSLQEIKKPKRSMNIRFRVFAEGIGFRYEFPEQPGLDSLEISAENTEFCLTGDHRVWWIPGDWDIYEHLYNETLFSEIDALQFAQHESLAQTYIPYNAVNTPVTMRTASGLLLSFHEAALTNYPGMTLRVDTENLTMRSELVGSERTEYKAKVSLPFETPWRTIQIAPDATDLIASKMILNLNEPNKLGDVSYVKPMKYAGIWWEMHLDKSTWDLASGRHGATTENAKRYIDFAAENNLGGILVEGWNTGWEKWIGVDDREGIFDFVTPYPDYDINEVVLYAKSKGVEIIMHHETSAAVTTYEQQLDTAYQFMESLGLHAVKTGYVGTIIPKGEYHHGQYMVQHYRKVLETAAQHKVAVNAHEPIKATGIRRTYPNAISREGLRGQEFNAWSSDGGNPPSHLPTVAFTRMLAGPIDFTPGAFNLKLEPYKPNNQVSTTLAQQLALYVVIYSPVQMACDLPEHYDGRPAFQFIRDVGVDWQQTEVLNGEVGEYVTIARKEKETGNWFLGSITDEHAREFALPLNFLDKDVTYEATLYKDAPDAHWDDNPESINIETHTLQATDTLNVQLAPGGGLAVSFIKK
ncbi:Retaining alpha-galactosidase precursor [Salinivirga cyanobacteriivorans]|uniref:Retaining alpha-galactosidase n=1 Tax=Salinivirga cyanobacteriivorans TaxID=1307839 RepID=A0A0S2HX64_9BACT|nr:glycoside hydrolase family 97 protein [Salinivirga cyanobacteriivorans]ALO14659.1 Retaining alpha-galactosidase precursor [Salinivirga cyanobacteriivorans]